MNEERFAEAKRGIRERLKNVCSNLSDSEFDALVDKIVLNELKPVERLGSLWGPKK